MTRWGIGPKFGMLISLYSGFIYLVQTQFFPKLVFSRAETVGMILIIIGFLLFLYSAATAGRYSHQGRLRTKGLYAYVRHPVYASWIILIIPGIVLYWGSILGFSIPVVAYIIFILYIHIEDNYLLRKFGLEYRNYMEEVNAIFPRLLFPKLLL